MSHFGALTVKLADPIVEIINAANDTKTKRPDNVPVIAVLKLLKAILLVGRVLPDRRDFLAELLKGVIDRFRKIANLQRPGQYGVFLCCLLIRKQRCNALGLARNFLDLADLGLNLRIALNRLPMAPVRF